MKHWPGFFFSGGGGGGGGGGERDQAAVGADPAEDVVGYEAFTKGEFSVDRRGVARKGRKVGEGDSCGKVMMRMKMAVVRKRWFFCDVFLERFPSLSLVGRRMG